MKKQETKHKINVSTEKSKPNVFEISIKIKVPENWIQIFESIESVISQAVAVIPKNEIPNVNQTESENSGSQTESPEKTVSLKKETAEKKSRQNPRVRSSPKPKSKPLKSTKPTPTKTEKNRDKNDEPNAKNNSENFDINVPLEPKNNKEDLLTTISKDKPDSESKNRKSSPSNGDPNLKEEEQENLSNFLVQQKNSWIKANNSDEQAFFTQHAIKKGWFEKICKNKKRIRISAAVELVMKINGQVPLTKIIEGRFHSKPNSASNASIVEKKPTDLLEEAEKRSLVQYVEDFMENNEKRKTKFFEEIKGGDVTRRRATVIIENVDPAEELEEVLKYQTV